jgi:hypothetical protein
VIALLFQYAGIISGAFAVISAAIILYPEFMGLRYLRWSEKLHDRKDDLGADPASVGALSEIEGELARAGRAGFREKRRNLYWAGFTLLLSGMFLAIAFFDIRPS